MDKRKPFESSWQAILDNTFVTAVTRLPAEVPADRRDAAARHALLCRILSEFDEMPGLSLTPVQAARLFGLSPDIALRILERLTDACLLRQSTGGEFALRVEES